MRQQPIQCSGSAAFKVLRGLLADPAPSMESDLISTAWTFAKSALWNCQQYSTKECGHAKEHIARFLRLYRNPRKGFSAFCQRIIIAQRFLDMEAGELQILPSAWLDRKYEKGFAISEGLYQDMRKIRESLPAYEREVKALAEAVLEFSEFPTSQNFRYWKSYFIERSKPELLNLFQLFVSNFLYSK